jgi:hypothetical protein
MFKFRERAPQLTGRWLEARISYAIDRGLGLLPPPQPHILVTGFWRSGTTWLQEALAEALHAKTIFEPCSVKALPPFNCLARFPGRDLATQEAYMPLSFSSFERSDLKFLDGVFSGYCYSNFTFECRRSVREAFRRRVIIKLVRAPFLLTSLLQRYQVKGIHITRHPCAVVDSLLHAKWDWTFEQVKFRHIFPRTKEVPANLRQDLEVLMRYDQRPDFERIAAYWAFTEKHVAKIRSERFTKVAYEALVRRGATLFPKLVKFAGGNPRVSLNLEKPSTQTAPERKCISVFERTDSWRRSLDPARRDRIEEVVNDLWPGGLSDFQDLAEEGMRRPKPAFRELAPIIRNS